MRLRGSYGGFQPPQTIQLPREFFDLLPALNGSEAKVLAVILRYTLARNRTAAPLSLDFLSSQTGLSIGAVKMALSELMRAGLIELAHPPGAGRPAVYRVRVKGEQPGQELLAEYEESNATAMSVR